VTAFRRSVPTCARTAIVKAEVDAMRQPLRHFRSREQFREFACFERELYGDGSRDPAEREVQEVLVDVGSQARGIVAKVS
jgi:hypothetical protein